MNTDLMFSSKKEDWTTPINFFQEIDKEFHFGLDAAATKDSALCKIWLGLDHPNIKKRDSFLHDWNKITKLPIWLNPPYGRGIKEWLKKASLTAEEGGIVVCLVPARTDTFWWHTYCMPYEIRFIKGRLKFGQSKNSAPFPSALIIMKKK